MKLAYLNRILNDGREGRRSSAPLVYVGKGKLHFLVFTEVDFLTLNSVFFHRNKKKVGDLTERGEICYLVVPSTLAGSVTDSEI